MSCALGPSGQGLIVRFGSGAIIWLIGGSAVRVNLLQIKVAHTAIVFILSACVLFLLHSAVAGAITVWTWVALGLVTAESIVLALSGWQCPLTVLAERMGAKEPGVADLFLPKWLADRIFPVCGTTFVVSCVLLAWRLASRG